MNKEVIRIFIALLCDTQGCWKFTLSKFTSHETFNGWFHCNTRQCHLCPFVERGGGISSNASFFAMYIKLCLNCRTLAVLCIISCTDCHMQYVDESSNSMKDRLCGHKFHLRIYVELQYLQTPKHNYFFG